jgi:hypothetical protein
MLAESKMTEDLKELVNGLKTTSQLDSIHFKATFLNNFDFDKVKSYS